MVDPKDLPSLLSLERLRWDGTTGPFPSGKQRVPRHRAGEKFLKGPVPLTWLALAGQQPGKALHVAIVLRFLAGVAGNSTVALSGAVLATFGVDRRAGHRGLGALERAHLVTVQRHRGRQPRVTLLEAPSP